MQIDYLQSYILPTLPKENGFRDNILKECDSLHAPAAIYINPIDNLLSIIKRDVNENEKQN